VVIHVVRPASVELNHRGIGASRGGGSSDAREGSWFRCSSQSRARWLAVERAWVSSLAVVHLRDRIALVTGGSSGIGRAAAVAFAHEGARVVVADIAEEAGLQTIEIIHNRGGEAIFVRTDVSSPIDVANLFDRALGTFGRLDFAFNNAGTEGTIAATVDCTEENWERTISVNLRSVWLCMKHELQHMLERGSGAIVNCSSIAGLVGYPGLPAYVASKHAIVGLTKTAALEVATRGVRVNAVCPGVIRTPMIDRIVAHDQETQQRLIASEPMGRMGKPEEIAAAVLWLCSDAASFVTGQAIAVDGGWVAR
jgi:NAD(P)-dependent dehydrogenase (short-subunit alcohol dehydrogenase family)